MIAGIARHSSKATLSTPLNAAYLMVPHSNRLPPLQLQKLLGAGSYKVAWLSRTNLRRAMVGETLVPDTDRERKVTKTRKIVRKTANASEIAKLLGVATATVIKWVKRGCPVVSQEPVGRKTRWVFNVAAVKKWRQQDLELREKPHSEFKNPLSLPKGLMSKEEERRFRRTIEGLIRPSD